LPTDFLEAWPSARGNRLFVERMGMTRKAEKKKKEKEKKGKD
jgi:hypothetical protein